MIVVIVFICISVGGEVGGWVVGRVEGGLFV